MKTKVSLNSKSATLCSAEHRFMTLIERRNFRPFSPSRSPLTKAFGEVTSTPGFYFHQGALEECEHKWFLWKFRAAVLVAAMISSSPCHCCCRRLRIHTRRQCPLASNRYSRVTCGQKWCDKLQRLFNCTFYNCNIFCSTFMLNGKSTRGSREIF